MNDDNLSSINRLVEFGMSMAVAQYMVQTMNKAMTVTQSPDSERHLISSTPKLFYALIEGNPVGPLSEEEIAKLISKKIILNETYLWKPGLPQWVIAEKLPEVLKLVLLSTHSFDKP